MILDRSAMEGEDVLSDLISLDATGLIIADAREEPRVAGGGLVVVGLHREGPLPENGLDAFDILLTVRRDAPRPWVSHDAPDEAVETLQAQVNSWPVAATVIAQVLRVSAELGFEDALRVESFAYSMLLASGEFRAWRAANPPRDRPPDDEPRVQVRAEGRGLELELTRPARRNAFDARMRDELCEALETAALHPDRPRVRLTGQGLDFSAGGDLDEFGRAADPALAHLVRSLRSPAFGVHRLGERIEAQVHGACIGAGIEIPAAAPRVIARRDARFRLPELSMGLIPGAGGTATIPRRIGRHRACYMAISGAEIDAVTALSWRLVDELA